MAAAAARVAAAYESKKKEIRKAVSMCSAFDGNRNSFFRWKKMFKMDMKAVSADIHLLPAAARLSARIVDSDAGVNTLIADYTKLTEISAILLSGICKLLPDVRKDQVLELASLTRAEVLHDVVVNEAHRAEVDAAIPADTIGQPHISAVMKFIYGQYEAATSSEKHALYRELEALKMVDLDFETLIASLNRTCSALEAIGEPVHSGKKYSLVLCAMPPFMKDTVANIEAGGKSYDEMVEILRSRLRTEKTQRETKSQTKKLDTDEKVLFLQSQKATCAKCHKSGHDISTCYELHPELRPAGSKAKQQGTNHSHHRGRGGNHHQFRNRSQRPEVDQSISCTWCYRKGHTIDQCHEKSRHEKGASEQKSLQTVKIAEDQDSDTLELNVKVESGTVSVCQLQCDSGADVNATGERHKLSKIKNIPAKKIGGFIDGPTTFSTEVGCLDVICIVQGRQKKIRFKEVYYVQGMKGTLISTGALSRQGIEYHGDACKANEQRDLHHTFTRDGQIVMEATQRAGSNRSFLNLVEHEQINSVQIQPSHRGTKGLASVVRPVGEPSLGRVPRKDEDLSSCLGEQFKNPKLIQETKNAN